jgi:tubulin polyglutamylase TTLL6/13
MVTDDEDTDEMYFSPTDGEDSETGAKKPQRIIMYCKHTHYDVIKEAGKNFLEFHLTKKEKSDWDIAWFDGPVSIKLLKDMNYNQRTNHYPGIYNLAKKNMLGRHLMKMQKLLPSDYNFFPTTYMLPHDYKDFREDSLTHFHSGKGSQYYIVKPEDSCQGKGIFLTRNWEAIKPLENMVIQKYLKKPHLIDGYKYDLRLYVFINGINPLRVYIYRDGLARFATSKYKPPSDRNDGNLFMHLTNYAINKESANYIEASGVDYESTGSKRSY